MTLDEFGIPIKETSGGTTVVEGFTAGYINADGNVQPITFSGTTASDDGSPLTGLTKKIFNTGKSEPAYSGGSGSAKYYKCATVTPASIGGIVVSGSGTDACNGTYTLTSGTGSSRVWTYGGYKIYWDGEGKWIIELISSETAYYTAEDYTGEDDPWDLTWMDSAGASPEPTLTESQATTASWTGYKANIDSTTGVWTFASTATTGLTYDKLTPVVNSVYDEKCTHRCTDYYVGTNE